MAPDWGSCYAGRMSLVATLARPEDILHRGNGIPRPRDKPPKIAFRPETVSAETENAAAKAHQLRASWPSPGNLAVRKNAWWWMHSRSNQSPPQISANREINREFCRFRRSAAILASSRRANSMTSSEIPYATEQGIFARPKGVFFKEQGIRN
jgi:hypothetical protein